MGILTLAGFVIGAVMAVVMEDEFMILWLTAIGVMLDMIIG